MDLYICIHTGVCVYIYAYKISIHKSTAQNVANEKRLG